MCQYFQKHPVASAQAMAQAKAIFCLHGLRGRKIVRTVLNIGRWLGVTWFVLPVGKEKHFVKNLKILFCLLCENLFCEFRLWNHISDTVTDTLETCPAIVYCRACGECSRGQLDPLLYFNIWHLWRLSFTVSRSCWISARAWSVGGGSLSMLLMCSNNCSGSGLNS